MRGANIWAYCPLFMKPNQIPEGDHSLDKILKQWRVDAPLPPRFQERVWQRIEREECQPAPSAWMWLRRVLEACVPRPKWAYSYAAILLIVGVVGGTLAAQAKSIRMETSLGSRYLQSIDPYQGAAHD